VYRKSVSRSRDTWALNELEWLALGDSMQCQKGIAFSLLLACSVLAAGKDKKKASLPDVVLQAETVLVVIDPDAGVALDAPLANTTARDDVEKALMKWGRFRLVTDVSTADLVITVRKGNGKITQGTTGGAPTNSRPVIFQPTDSGVRMGGSRGTPPTGDDPTRPQSPGSSPGVEVGPAQDTFAVYIGKRNGALDFPPAWRYIAKDALRSPSVPAVDEFKKAITEAEKERAAKP